MGDHEHDDDDDDDDGHLTTTQEALKIVGCDAVIITGKAAALVTDLVPLMASDGFAFAIANLSVNLSAGDGWLV